MIITAHKSLFLSQMVIVTFYYCWP